MTEKKQQIQLLQYCGDKKAKFKIVISSDLETKIRTFCALSPDREWSGVLFYLYKGSFKEGITIYANDLYLMDQGNGVHTEFDLDAPEITRYMVMEGLINHCMGLIHSHNRMKAFFSGEDADTLVTHGQNMHNFVSLVVNNEGNYVARLTRQVNFKGLEEKIVSGTFLSPVFNTDDMEKDTYSHKESSRINQMFIEYVDLDIVKHQANITAIHNTIERFGEVNSKCSYQKPVELKGYPIVPIPKFDKEEGKQGSLFDNLDDEETEDIEIPKDIIKELEKIPWKALGYDNWITQLLYGSPFANYTGFDKNSIAFLNRVYKKRFKNDMDFAMWFEAWVDYLIPEFNIPISKQSEVLDSEEALIYQTYMFIKDKDLAYKETMLQSLLIRVS